jgi:hypothetical protein
MFVNGARLLNRRMLRFSLVFLYRDLAARVCLLRNIFRITPGNTGMQRTTGPLCDHRFDLLPSGLSFRRRELHHRPLVHRFFASPRVAAQQRGDGPRGFAKRFLDGWKVAGHPRLWSRDT